MLGKHLAWLVPQVNHAAYKDGDVREQVNLKRQQENINTRDLQISLLNSSYLAGLYP